MEMARGKMRAAAASVVAGAVLTVLKLTAGIATASLGLIAEAAHSALDLGAAVLTWFAVRTSSRPPDADHHYGHGKVENLAALAETALLVVTSAWILKEAASRMLGGGPEAEPTIWAFGVMFLSIAVDVRRSRDLRRVAEASGSQALEADALHFSTDIFSSAVVILGLLGAALARSRGWTWLALADPIAACVVAVVVLVLSWKLGKRAVDVLMDRAPAGLARGVDAALDGLQGLQDAPRMRIRQAGDRVFVDVELRLRRGLPLAEGDRIASHARSRIKSVVGPRASVLVQLLASHDEEASLRERVSTAVAMEGHQAHNISLRQETGRTHVDLHLELEGRMTLSDAHGIADRVESRILDEVPEVDRVDIHLELHEEAPDTTEPLEADAREALERRIHEVATRVVGERSVHDMLIARTSAGVYLSCHCFLPADTSLRDAHELTDNLERALKREIRDLGRVVIHAEPEGHHAR